MTPRRKTRLMLVVLLVTGVSGAVALLGAAFQENMLYFYDPSAIAAGEAPTGRSIRVGGLVQMGSVQRLADGLTVEFMVTDTVEALLVSYTGILPDLFQEGQSIIATGRMENGNFMAQEVLAKHDENYMPPAVAESLQARKEESAAKVARP